MKKIIAATVLLVSLTACGTYEDVNITPLDDNPTPSCIAVSNKTVESWDGDVKDTNYSARYCLEDK